MTDSCGVTSTTALVFQDEEPDSEQFMIEAVDGLRNDPKQLPCKYFYDEEGSRLFEQICELPEYYPTRTERSIMKNSVSEMADAIGPNALIVEYGS